jgi:hypothetical protein
MTTAEELKDKIFDTAIDGAIEAGVGFSEVLEALRLAIDEAACLAADEYNMDDPAVDARIADVTLAIASLQEEIAGAISRKKLAELEEKYPQCPA